MDSGVVYYKLEGESEERHFTGETLNALYAATKVNPTDMIKAADDAWADVSSRFQGKMAEAAFFKEQFGTVSGASMDSAIALANANLNSEGWTKDWKESAEYQSIIDSQNALEILGLYKNSQSVDTRCLVEHLEVFQDLSKVHTVFVQFLFREVEMCDACDLFYYFSVH